METFLAILRLVLIGLLPPLAAVGFYLLQNKTKFGQWKMIYRQLIAGVVFGGIAIMATEFGSNVNGAVLNVRDAAAVTAGLLFGLPGGATAGLIGGAERFASAYWNNTFDTQWACSISTFISGLLAGFLRRFVFVSKRPSWALGLLVGLVTETFHILMIFFTNAGNPVMAFGYVRALGNKMITANMISAGLAMGALDFLEYLLRPDKTKKKKTRAYKMRSLIALNLAIIGSVAIGVSGVLTYGLQSSMAYRNSISVLTNSVSDATADVDDTSNNNILAMAENAAKTVEEHGQVPTDEFLVEILPASGVSELHYFNAEGVVTATTVESSRGFDLYDPIIDQQQNQQALEFRKFLEDENAFYFVQAFMPMAQDATVKKKYAAVKLSYGGFVQVGFDAAKFYGSIMEIVTQVVRNRTIGEKGYMLVCDDDLYVHSRDAAIDGKSLVELGFPANIDEHAPLERLEGKIQNVDSYYMYDVNEGFHVIAVVDVDEMHRSRDMATFLGVYLEILIFAFLFIGVYTLIDHLVLRDLTTANQQLAKITAGDLEQKLEQHHTEELLQLTQSINATVDSLKGYIAKEASRYDEELAFGKQIQMNSLPAKGAYLFRHDFSIFGNMITAKQVGGDFYDYFLLTDKRIAFLIADVSGKGIPAAMFMMRTKSIIKSMAENGLPIADVISRANDRVCEGNETGTFVTCWLGICDLATGLVEFVNAGHNPPMFLSGNEYRRLDMKRDLVLGAMSGVPYRRQTVQMKPGDVLFLYTDGITEAEAGPQEFYGEQRLVDFLNGNIDNRDPFSICQVIRKDVFDFVGDHEQSDDMTMVAFTYLGTPREKKFEFASTSEGVGNLCNGVEETLREFGIERALIDKSRLVVEEVAANIAFHAYEGTSGIGTLDLFVNATQVVLTFGDYGPRFNPLEKEDPDLSLSYEERPIGGLGIYMIKKIASKYFYTYQDKRNVFTIIINR